MDFFSYISSIIRDKMRDKVQVVLMIVVLIGIVSIVPTLIRWFFWILLQMMYYPLTTIIILTNLFVWNYVYIRYTEKKLHKKTK
jgi:uncharacterized membrane protein